MERWQSNLKPCCAYTVEVFVAHDVLEVVAAVAVVVVVDGVADNAAVAAEWFVVKQFQKSLLEWVSTFATVRQLVPDLANVLDWCVAVVVVFDSFDVGRVRLLRLGRNVDADVVVVVVVCKTKTDGCGCDDSCVAGQHGSHLY
jgi:hypothetical protein